MNETRLRLTITISYDLNGTSVESVINQLNFAVEHLAGEGLLSGDLDATVSEWEHKVDKIDKVENLI